MLTRQAFRSRSFIPLALALGVLGGCATGGNELAGVKSTADQALQTADKAQQGASAANGTANQALQAANQANSKADQAMQVAQGASSKTDQLSREVAQLKEEIDRMFKKSMAK